MRKDAKIGFAIGGVLLVVLTVYAIVVPKHKKSNTTVSIVTTPPGDAPASPPLLSGGNASSGSPATPPVDPAPPAHPDTTAGTVPQTPSALTPDAGVTPPASTDGPPGIGEKEPVTMGGLTPDHSLAPGRGTARAPTKSPKSHTAELEVPVATPTGDRTYVVQTGQTLSIIAREVYGNPRFWVAIQRENKSIKANQLRVGQKINLPDITPPQQGVVEEAADVESPVNVIEPPRDVIVTRPTGHSVRTDAHRYVVKSGDSLYKIARSVLGSGRRADALYALNKDLIGPDKARLKLGMVLKLPENGGLASSVPIR